MGNRYWLISVFRIIPENNRSKKAVHVDMQDEALLSAHV
jgi:hypothetical protein